MKKLIAALLIAVSSYAHAGFAGLTHHSRANCGFKGLIFNESVSWQLGIAHDLNAVSYHYISIYDNRQVDWQRTNPEHTWRSAAYDTYHKINEVRYVKGVHWMRTNGSPRGWLIAQTTFAQNCNIYDGWWDQ